MKKNFIITLVILAAVLVVFLFTRSGQKDAGDKANAPVETSASTLYKEAKAAESREEYPEAVSIYRRIIEQGDNEKLALKAGQALNSLNTKILFSRTQTEDSMIYTVKKGDTLGRIAREFDTTIELIMRSNGLSRDLIRVGQRLKISTATYSVHVDYSDNVLTLKANQDLFKTYRVATGIDNCTPIGSFKIVNKLKDPVWYSTGAVVPSGSPDNILGTRWMGISISGYGIHGTTIPDSIGKHVTAGCVRMQNEDAEELYTILPLGTEVTITE